MGIQGVIRETPALFNQFQIGFTGLEKNLDVPYADILETPIKFVGIPMPDIGSDMGKIISAFISDRTAA